MNTKEKFIAASALLPFSVLSGGIVLLKSYQWLVMPTLNTQPLTFIQCVALGMFIRLLTIKTENEEKENEKTISEYLSEQISLMIAKPIVFLGVAYIVHLFL